jgi:large subunit ribosomal protein L2
MVIKNKNFFLLDRARKMLMYGFSKRAGKNCFGRKTVFTQSGGYRLFYNCIDMKRTVSDIFVLLKVEKSVLYTSFLGLVCYSNGIFSYILLSDYINQIYSIYAGFVSFYGKGPNFLQEIVAGNFIHHIEVKPLNGAKIMRAAGSMAFIISKESEYSFLKMKSG